MAVREVAVVAPIEMALLAQHPRQDKETQEGLGFNLPEIRLVGAVVALGLLEAMLLATTQEVTEEPDH
jgi:nicotinic acid phosphoribosyltransferase